MGRRRCAAALHPAAAAVRGVAARTAAVLGAGLARPGARAECGARLAPPARRALRARAVGAPAARASVGSPLAAAPAVTVCELGPAVSAKSGVTLANEVSTTRSSEGALAVPFPKAIVLLPAPPLSVSFQPVLLLKLSRNPANAGRQASAKNAPKARVISRVLYGEE